MTDLRIMSSVQPPFNRAIWSAWHIVVKGVIFLAMRMMRLMARSVRLMTLIRLCGSELIEYCCKKITIKQCQQYFYLDAAQCKKWYHKTYFWYCCFCFCKVGLPRWVAYLTSQLTNKQYCLMARSVRLMMVVKLCRSELTEYCCKNITIKQCQQYFYLDAAQCSKKYISNVVVFVISRWTI